MIGVVIGAGIFESAPIIARQFPDIVSFYMIWLIGGVLSLAGALCYVELATVYPEDGGDYAYLRRTYGNLFGFLFAWSKVLIIRPGSIAAMSFPFATYFNSFLEEVFGIYDTNVLLIAMGVVLFFSIINCFELNSSKKVQNIISVAKIVGLLIIISLGLLSFDLPIVESVNVLPDQLYIDNIGLALILVLFTFGGWSELAYVATEVKNPEKNIFRALFFGTLIISVLYILVNYAFISILGHNGVASSTAVATDAVRAVFPAYASIFVSLLICVSVAGALDGLIFTGGRLCSAFAKEYSKTKAFSLFAVNKTAPVNAVIFQCIISELIIILTGSFDRTLIYTSAVVWFFYLTIGISLFISRRKYPTKFQTSKATLYPWTMVVFCLSSIYLTYSSVMYDFKGTLIAFTLVASGIPVYFFVKQKRESL